MESTRRQFIKTIGATAGAIPIVSQAGTAETNSAAESRKRASATHAIRNTAQADFYVSPKGNDSDSGTLERPFQSLARARDAVLQLKKGHKVEKPIVVALRGGTYRMSESVVFSSTDSGTEKSPITYMAYPGESPILSGGQAVTGWGNYKDRILSAVLFRKDDPREDDQYYSFRELFFNGRRQIRARYPNYDPRNPYDGGWAFIESTEPADALAPVSFHWEPGVFPRRWAKPDQGEIFVIPGLAWLSHLLPIREVDHDQRMVTVTRRLLNRWDKLTKGNRFYVQNLLEELDQPGEWCFDSETYTLYFWPPEEPVGDDNVTVPMTDRLIELRATTRDPVRYLQFRGLTFTETLTVFPNPIPQRPDYLDCNRPNSGGYAFYMENAEHCTIENCRFDQVGGDAIRLHNYNAHNRIIGNEIVGAGAQGICLAYLDFWPYDFPAVSRGQSRQLHSVSSRLPWAIGNVISGNHIHHCGVIDNFGAGIHVHGLNCQDNVIANNSIHDMPHHAIYFSMGLGRNIIEYNDLHTLCLVMADAGGVYSNRWSVLDDDEVLRNNNIIRYNLIRDVQGVYPFGKEVSDPVATPSQDRIKVPYFTWGIYFDNSPRRAHVYGNITIGNVWGGVFLGGGYSEPSDCLVENNILVDSSVYQFDLKMREDAAGNRFVRNIVYFRNPEAALLRVGSPKGIAECDHNLYFQVGEGKLRVVGMPGDSLERWRGMGYDQHSVVADPLFVDPDHGDYRLKPESPALKLGFRPIPVEHIGLRGYSAAAKAGREGSAQVDQRKIE